MIAGTLGYSRQYYYKHCKEEQKRRVKERSVLSMIHAERRILPRLGGRKLYHQISPALQACGLKVGRDGLFSILKENDLLVKRRRSYITTTNSKHWLKKYPNLIKQLTVTAPEQLWVSDITYIKTDEGNCYLNLVTDAYSRRIMGYSIADNMSTEAMKPAYEMAIRQRRCNHQLIHHSDRGLQYCSGEYVGLSESANILISMTENGDPYENALAERMNRTLKEEFGLGGLISTKSNAYKLVQEAVELYNNYRPHTALKMKTPQNVHLQKSRPLEATGTI